MAAQSLGNTDSLGRCSLPLVILHLLTGIVLGTLAGLGIGGGSLLILWLTLVLNISQPQARIINLLFFIPCALVSCLIRHKQGALNIKKLLPGILAGCISAAVCSIIGRNMDLAVLKKLFGGLLILTGLREVFYKPK